MENSGIILHFPQKDEPQNLACPPHPLKIKEWLERLPLDNTGETARLVYQELTALNRTTIGAQHRFQILESFRPSVHHVANALKKHYLCSTLPLSNIAIKTAQLTRELYLEMANGYKIIIDNLLTNESTASMTLTHMHRAMRYLSEALLTSYQMYAPSPTTAWHDMHQMYRYAEHKKLHESPVLDNQNTLSPQRSINDIYKQALLLALANPYQLSQDGITEVYTALVTLAPYGLLNTVSNPGDAAGSFIINLTGDDPPTSLAVNNNCSAESCRALDTTDLIYRLYQILENEAGSPEPNATRNDTSASPIASGLARWLISAWGIVSRRSFARLRKTGRINIAIGLDAIHHFIRKTSVVDATLSFRKKDIHPAPASPPNPPRANNDPIALFSRSLQNTAHRNVDTSRAHATHTCTIINESAGGSGLLWKVDGNSTPFKAGEIIGIQTANGMSNNEWGIAVIRWLKDVTSSEVEFGIEMLAPTAEAVLIRTHAADRSGDAPLNGLLLPELTATNQSATLITPAHAFQTGKEIILSTNSGTRHALLTESLEDTGGFMQFLFMPVQVMTPETLASAVQTHDKDFELLWAFI
ncbi:MAG: hypothetical protein M3A44_13965 [Gammaproteobacteria bacterium]